MTNEEAIYCLTSYHQPDAHAVKCRDCKYYRSVEEVTEDGRVYKTCKSSEAEKIAIEALDTLSWLEEDGIIKKQGNAYVLNMKECTDAISRQAVIEYIESEEADLWHKTENEAVCKDIMNMPSVTPIRPKGESKQDVNIEQLLNDWWMAKHDYLLAVQTTTDPEHRARKKELVHDLYQQILDCCGEV